MNYTKKEEEIALSWVFKQITLREAQKKLKKSSMGIYVTLALILKQIVKNQYEN